MSAIQKIDRRTFLKTGAAAASGLALGFYLPENNALNAQDAVGKLNAYVHVGTDDTITLYIHKAEMGQGTVTSLSMLLAEELECEWSKIRTEFPGVDPMAFGPMQGVFGSMSIRTSWEPLRKAGATAAEMLVQAAALKWNVPKSQCRAENNAVLNLNTKERLSYGSLAEAASKLPVPQYGVALKDPTQFKLVGKSQKRMDTPAKVSGKTTFGIDVKVPGMLYATLLRSPVFGGKVKSFDATKAKAVPGVKNVVQISNGVAVLAENTWSAMEGRKALAVEWDEGALAATSSATIRKTFADLAEKPGAVARTEGDVAAALTNAPRKIEAVYEVPYLSHAPMEPLNAVAHVRQDGADVWSGMQIQSVARETAAKIAGLPPEKVQIHTVYLGGGFGRRGGADFIGEAVDISKVAGVPVKLQWTRDDDLQHDTYRPASYTKFTSALDEKGYRLCGTLAWFARHSQVCAMVWTGPAWKGSLKSGMQFRIFWWNTIPRLSGFRSAIGGLSAIRTTRSSPKAFWTSWPLPPSKILSSSDASCSRRPRVCWVCSSWLLRRRAGASRFLRDGIAVLQPSTISAASMHR